MGCQKSITKAIVAREADYVLNLKGNHRHLHGEVAAWFEPCQASEQIGPAHSHQILDELANHRHGAAHAPGGRDNQRGDPLFSWQLALERGRADHCPGDPQSLGCGKPSALVTRRECQGQDACIRRETSLKASVKSKRCRAGWDGAYMLKVLDIGVLSIWVRLP